jgi:hypothetical protein
MKTYPTTPANVIEVRYVREVIPTKYQDIIRLWHEGRTLDVLTHVPVDVLADVLYNLGSKFTDLVKEEVPKDVQVRAANELKQLLEASESASPKEVESWLKSFLTKEQLDQLCGWVRDGVILADLKWERVGGGSKEQGAPAAVRLVFGVVDLFIRVPRVRCSHVNLFEDVIVRDLLVKKVETKLVNLEALKFYGEFMTWDTTYYSDRTMPAIDLVQDIGLTDVVRPTPDQEAKLQMLEMTRSVRLDDKARADAIRRGLPPVSLQGMKITTLHSQAIGALLEGEMAYIVIWHNPRKTDPVRFLTTVITTTPYGMARVWALRGNEHLCDAVAAFDHKDAPIGALVSWVIDVIDQRGLFVRLDKPLAVVALGRRRIEPWLSAPEPPVSNVKMMEQLEPTGAGAD